MVHESVERFLITGATGFVGSWLTEELRAAYPNALLFGTTHGNQTGDRNGVTLIRCDVTDAAQVASVVRTTRPTRVFHLAGIASAGGGTDPATLKAVNADAAVLLLRMVADYGAPCRVLLASSGYVYGATGRDRLARETDPLHAIGAYAESKTAMEAAVEDFLANAGKTHLCVMLPRAFNHTGARQTEAFVIPAFARQIAAIEAGRAAPVVRVGNLDALRDFLHVADVVRAYRLLLETEPCAPLSKVNVASGVGRTIRSLLDGLIALSTASVSVETDPSRLRASDLPECVGNPGKLCALTGWEPRFTIEETLGETLEWWRRR